MKVLFNAGVKALEEGGWLIWLVYLNTWVSLHLNKRNEIKLYYNEYLVKRFDNTCQTKQFTSQSNTRAYLLKRQILTIKQEERK